ncbi:MAG: hypothetical protein IAB99_07160 [Bacteroidetes bacterium]|uniref:Phage tail protein n=1 Tax=Candidatus Cryptobacteroides faecipullorum TaxID=2840764 RepID=A0A9D9I7U8_9BACT|nr:hypothetical protein [Candidatus Cryptobacteroides faecipullorum]
MAETDARMGHSRKVYLTDSVVSSVTSGVEEQDWLTGETTNTVNLNGNLIEVSDKSSDGWQKFISGIKGATVDVTVNVFDTDTNQKKMLENFFSGDKVFVFVGDLTTKTGYAMEALISSISETNDNGSVSTRSMSLTANGEVKNIVAA